MKGAARPALGTAHTIAVRAPNAMKSFALNALVLSLGN